LGSRNLESIDSRLNEDKLCNRHVRSHRRPGFDSYAAQFSRWL